MAPGTVAIAIFGKAVSARDVASPEFCIPISMARAFLRDMGSRNIRPSANPAIYPKTL